MSIDNDTPMTKRGGLLLPTPAKPRLRLAQHLTADASTTPTAVDYVSNVPRYQLYDNDQIGDCGPASLAHFLTAAGTYGDGTPDVASLDDVIDIYSRVSGYDPHTGAHDDGVVMQDLLNEARKGGIGDQEILAFAEVNLADYDEVLKAINLFGGVLIGAWLPTAAEAQFDAHKPWDFVAGPTGKPGSWGGHAVHVGAYNTAEGTMVCTTWGQTQKLTKAWWTTYCLEAWVLISREWVRANGTTPAGLDLYGLGEELAAMTGGQNPIPKPTPAPAPAPAPTPTPSPAPAPAPAPADDRDQTDQKFAADIEPFIESAHRGGNLKAARIIRAYLERLGLR